MKNFFLRLSLFLCGICVGQPTPPTLAYADYTKVKYKSDDKIEIPTNFVRVDFNYGFENTLDFHVVKGKNKNLIGVGYSTYIGNDVKGKSIGADFGYNYLNTYEVRDKAYYLLFGKQIKRLSISAKLGVYTVADYNNYILSGNPNIYYAKVNTDVEFQYGGHLSWSFNRSSGLGLGYDKFNGVTIGVTTLF